MYISQMELIQQKLQATKTYSVSNVIKDLIAAHERDPRYAMTATAVKYYDDQHDILDKDFRESWVYNTKESNGYDSDRVEGAELLVNQNNSNHHNIHNYFRQLIDQESDYIAGNPPAVIVEGAGTRIGDTGTDEMRSGLKSFENELTKVTSDEEFAQFIANTIIEVRKKGNTFWHPYYGRTGKLKHLVLDSDKIIPIYDTAYEIELVAVIRYYDIVVIKNGSEQKRVRVEWWTDQNVTYYLQNDMSDFAPEIFEDGSPNPAPHFTESKVLEPGSDPVLVPGTWGRVPFIEIVSDKGKTSLLRRIKGLQDAYNHLSSKLANDEIDLVSLFWVVQGYGGEFSSSVRKKIELNKGVSIDDPAGKIDAKQVELNTSERIAYLEMIKRDIFRIGEGLVPDLERSGNINTTELEMRYASLDMKARRMVREIKVGLKTLFEFIVEDMARGTGKQYDASLVKAEFHFAKIIDRSALIDDLLKVRGLVPDTIIMSLVPFVDDPNQAWIELQAQQKRMAKEKADAYSVPRAGKQTVDGKIQQAANEANSVQ